MLKLRHYLLSTFMETAVSIQNQVSASKFTDLYRIRDTPQQNYFNVCTDLSKKLQSKSFLITPNENVTSMPEV